MNKNVWLLLLFLKPIEHTLTNSHNHLQKRQTINFHYLLITMECTGFHFRSLVIRGLSIEHKLSHQIQVNPAINIKICRKYSTYHIVYKKNTSFIRHWKHEKLIEKMKIIKQWNTHTRIQNYYNSIPCLSQNIFYISFAG